MSTIFIFPGKITQIIIIIPESRPLYLYYLCLSGTGPTFILRNTSKKNVFCPAVCSPEFSLLAAFPEGVSACDMLTQRNKEVALFLRREQRPGRMCLQDSRALEGRRNEAFWGKYRLQLWSWWKRGVGRGANQLGPNAPAALLYHQHLAQGASRPAARKRWPLCFLFSSSILVYFFRRSARDTVGRLQASVRVSLRRSIPAPP